jgi:hypothetical protein
MRNPPLSKRKILTLFSVDLSSGRVFWIKPPKNHSNLIGKEAGAFRFNALDRSKGYWVIHVDGKSYRRGRIIYRVACGDWPDILDHIDGNGVNDIPTNLRKASVLQNSWNHRTRKKKSDLPMGVRADRHGRYVARISCRKKHFHLGVFDSPEEAQSVYISKRKELFGEYCGL